MPLKVRVKAQINRPSHEVASYAFEPSYDPVWIGGITEVNLLTGRPIGLGARVQRLAKFMGRNIYYILEVVEFEPEKLMVMKSVKSPFPMKVTYRFDDLGGNRTLAQLQVEGSAESFYGIGDIFMAPMVRRNLRGDLKRLKRICEATI